MSSTEQTTITKDRLEEMLLGLEGVTPGPWERHEPGEETLIITGDEHGETVAVVPWGREITCAHEMGNAHRDASHIARCDPDTMRQIITLALQSLALQGLPHFDRTRCATEGCGKVATEYFERGGVGSYHCADCTAKIQSLRGSGVGVGVTLPLDAPLSSLVALAAERDEILADFATTAFALRDAEAKVERMERALEPLADLDGMLSVDDLDSEEFFRHDGTVLMVGDIRAARSALNLETGE